jgi:Lon protease-like protein
MPQMFPFLRAGTRSPTTLPLFPLKTVLFPGRLLPLKVFEQRYIDMTTACLKDEQPFGVCLLTRGEEVAQRVAQRDHVVARTSIAFALIGTQARIVSWDMPQLGILHVRAEGLGRFRVESHVAQDDGLVVGTIVALPPEPNSAILTRRCRGKTPARRSPGFHHLALHCGEVGRPRAMP